MTHDEDMSLDTARAANVNGYTYAMRMHDEIEHLRASLKYTILGCIALTCSVFTLAWWVFSR